MTAINSSTKAPGTPRRVGAGLRARAHGVPVWVPFGFLLPNIVGVLAFTLIPLGAGILVAFTDWDVVSGLGNLRWVGSANLQQLLHDPVFLGSLGRTGQLMLAVVPITMMLGLALSLGLNKPVAGRGALRAMFFMPYIVTTVAVGTVWLILLNPQHGLVNQALAALGLNDLPGWLTSSDWALPAVMLISIWSGVGYVAVIYLAALQDLPFELYEAATVDGAGKWTQFRVITLPALMPTTTFLFITSLISTSQGFGLIAFLTSGGPGTSTTTASFYLYQQGFQFYRFGYAAAIGLVMFVCILVLSLLMWRFQRNKGLTT